MPLNYKFAKYHGNANDFIIINHEKKIPSLSELINLAPKLCDRHKGIGADGILLLSPNQEGLDMIVINRDGSIAQNCGNGLRCAARWYFDSYDHTSQVMIYLGSKKYLCEREEEYISVQMGEGSLEYLNNINNTRSYKINLGNEHLVLVFDANININLKLVRQIQKEYPQWPEYNLGFVVANNQGFYSKVFERGVGFTKSCGSGACAAAAALSLGYTEGQTHNLMLTQPGGPIWVDAHVLENNGGHARFLLKQRGAAEAVFLGVL